MSRQVALLRAVNVAGHGKIAMADLCAAAEEAGLKGVRSLLQSGNLVFDAATRSASAVESLLESVCAKKFGVKTDVHIRTAAEIAAIVAANPFTREAKSDPGFLHVLFMRAAPVRGGLTALRAAINGREIVRDAGVRGVYIFYPDGAGRSKLTPAVLARHLGASGTARNWNTVLKLAAKAAE
jgi:uncharacterized protein (DUF1697 family)